MREALVAVFDTAPHADEAVRALEMANVSPSDIRRYHHPARQLLEPDQSAGNVHSEGDIVASGHGYSERRGA